MKYGNKRYLITREQLDKLNRQQNNISTNSFPVESHASEIVHPDVIKTKQSQIKLKQTLTNPNFSTFEKVLRHSEQLNHYLKNLKKAVTVPKAQAILGSEVWTDPSSSTTPISYTTPTNSKEEQPLLDFDDIIPPPPPPNLLDVNTTPRSTVTVFPKQTKSVVPKTKTKVAKAKSPSALSLRQQQQQKRQVYSKNKLLQKYKGETLEEASDYIDVLENKGLTWNENTGVIKIGKKTFTDSNILSLLHDLVDNTNFSKPSTLKAVKKQLYS